MSRHPGWPRRSRSCCPADRRAGRQAHAVLGAPAWYRPVHRHRGPRRVPPAHLPQGQPWQGHPTCPAGQFSTVRPHPATTAVRERGEPARPRAGHHQGRAQRQDGPAAGRWHSPGQNARQVHILTGRQAGDLPAADVIYRIGSRWREENYFPLRPRSLRPGRTEQLRRHRRGPRTARSPARQREESGRRRQDREQKKNLAAAEAARDAKLHRPAQPAPGQPAVVITDQMLAKLDVPGSPPHAASSKTPRPRPRPSPPRSRCQSTTPNMVRLDTETKLITHAIRMAA